MSRYKDISSLTRCVVSEKVLNPLVFTKHLKSTGNNRQVVTRLSRGESLEERDADSRVAKVEERVLRDVTINQNNKQKSFPIDSSIPTIRSSKVFVVGNCERPSSKSIEHIRDNSTSILRYKVSPFPQSSLEMPVNVSTNTTSKNGNISAQCENNGYHKIIHGVKIRGSGKKVFYKNENFSTIKNQLIAQFGKNKDTERNMSMISEINICSTLDRNMKKAIQSRLTSKENSTYFPEFRLEDDTRPLEEKRIATQTLQSKILKFAIQASPHTRGKFKSFKQLRRGLSLDTKEVSHSYLPDMKRQDPSLPTNHYPVPPSKIHEKITATDLVKQERLHKEDHLTNISSSNFTSCLISDSNVLKAHIKRSSKTQKNSAVHSKSKIAITGNRSVYPSYSSSVAGNQIPK